MDGVRTLRVEGQSVGPTGTTHVLKHEGFLCDEDGPVAWEVAPLVTASQELEGAEKVRGRGRDDLPCCCSWCDSIFLWCITSYGVWLPTLVAKRMLWYSMLLVRCCPECLEKREELKGKEHSQPGRRASTGVAQLLQEHDYQALPRRYVFFRIREGT